MTEYFPIFPALVTKQDLEKSKEYLLKQKLIIPTALPIICVIELPISAVKIYNSLLIIYIIYYGFHNIYGNGYILL